MVDFMNSIIDGWPGEWSSRERRKFNVSDANELGKRIVEVKRLEYKTQPLRNLLIDFLPKGDLEFIREIIKIDPQENFNVPSVRRALFECPNLEIVRYLLTVEGLTDAKEFLKDQDNFITDSHLCDWLVILERCGAQGGITEKDEDVWNFIVASMDSLMIERCWVLVQALGEVVRYSYKTELIQYLTSLMSSGVALYSLIILCNIADYRDSVAEDLRKRVLQKFIELPDCEIPASILVDDSTHDSLCKQLLEYYINNGTNYLVRWEVVRLYENKKWVTNQRTIEKSGYTIKLLREPFYSDQSSIVYKAFIDFYITEVLKRYDEYVIEFLIN